MSVDKRLTTGVHNFTTPSGATLTYTLCGTGPRFLVNIAPGWGRGSPLYEKSFTFLQEAFTYIHVEVRGSRGSSFPDDLSQMSSWHMSGDVESLRVHLGRDLLDGVLGHSNGGVLGPEADAVGHAATKAILDAHPDREAVAAAEKFNIDDFETDEDLAKAMGAFIPLYFANPARDIENFRKNIMTNLPQPKCARALFPAEQQDSNQDSQAILNADQTVEFQGYLRRGQQRCPLSPSATRSSPSPCQMLARRLALRVSIVFLGSASIIALPLPFGPGERAGDIQSYGEGCMPFKRANERRNYQARVI